MWLVVEESSNRSVVTEIKKFFRVYISDLSRGEMVYEIADGFSRRFVGIRPSSECHYELFGGFFGCI